MIKLLNKEKFSFNNDFVNIKILYKLIINK